jgi:hypothetical protein
MNAYPAHVRKLRRKQIPQKPRVSSALFQEGIQGVGEDLPDQGDRHRTQKHSEHTEISDRKRSSIAARSAAARGLYL